MWEDVLGHEQQKNFLQQYLRADERPHALMFVGAVGLGKKKLALEFAKSLLCSTHTGTDLCEACRLMNLQDGNLSHPDFLLIKREYDEEKKRLKDISIEQIRDVIAKSAFAPVMSDTKVCIIEDFDTSSEAAANCFLKLLEEPPAGWVLILIVTDLEKILPTILSRVVTLRFNGVSENLMVSELQKYALTAEQACLLARISEGSIGYALQLKEQDAFSWRQQAVAFLEALPLAMPLSYLNDRTWQNKSLERDQGFLFVRLLYLLVHDLLLCSLHIKNGLYNKDIIADLYKSNMTLWRTATLKEILAVVQQAHTALMQNAGVKLALESMALKIDKIVKNR